MIDDVGNQLLSILAESTYPLGEGSLWLEGELPY